MTKPLSSFHLGVFILGGGASLRMGKPKLLLPWGDTSILGHLLRLYSNANTTQVAVVCSIGDENIIAELDRLAWPIKSRILNPEITPEMFSSVLCGFKWDGASTPMQDDRLVGLEYDGEILIWIDDRL